MTALLSTPGAEEGLEDAAALSLVQARAGVANREPHMWPRAGPWVSLNESLVEVDIRRLQDEASTFGHGITGIFDEMKHGALHLRSIHAGQPQVLRETQGQLDPGGNDHRKRQRGHELVEAERLGSERLLSGELEEIPDERGDALSRLLDRCQVAAGRLVGLEPLEQGMAPPDDDGEKAVE